jgi:hypothetical protein
MFLFLIIMIIFQTLRRGFAFFFVDPFNFNKIYAYTVILCEKKENRVIPENEVRNSSSQLCLIGKWYFEAQ